MSAVRNLSSICIHENYKNLPAFHNPPPGDRKSIAPKMPDPAAQCRNQALRGQHSEQQPGN